jgi:hypothetical protein
LSSCSNGGAINAVAETPDKSIVYFLTTCQYVGWFWLEYYNGIKYSNVVISRIDNTKWTSETERNAVLGSAYFHRAYRYYRLTQQFGDVPFIGKEITEPKLDLATTKREVILEKSKDWKNCSILEKTIPR